MATEFVKDTKTTDDIRKFGQLAILRPLFQEAASLPATMSWDAWLANEETRAKRVAKYREYVFGEHDIEKHLTDEMKNQLRITLDGRSLALNHCEKIIEKLANRLKVQKVEASVRNGREVSEDESKLANEWIEDLFIDNRFDALQLAIHNDSPQDSVSYVLVDYDQEADRVRLTQEEAYDGYSGMLVVYGADNTTITLAIKLWHETMREDGKLVDNVRVNLYYPDRIEKYIFSGGRLNAYRDRDTDKSNSYALVDRSGKALGVPVIPFTYKGRKYNRQGLGRLDGVLWPQDMLNRVMLSILSTGENTGFPLKYLIGLQPPEEITPGTVLWVGPQTEKDADGNPRPSKLSKEQIDMLGAIQVGQLPAGDANALLAIAVFVRNEMYRISGTPYYEDMSSGISGETLKQLDIDLVATAQKCHVAYGNSWEDVVWMAARMEAAYGDAVEGERVLRARLSTIWESAEIRDTVAITQNAKTTGDFIGNLDTRTKLEMVAEIHNWDETKINTIMERIEADAERASNSDLGRSIPSMGSRTNSTTPTNPFNLGGANLGDPLNLQAQTL
jgi:hypothetical protein